MTKRILASYTLLLSLTVVLATAGVMTVQASEVTGNISSDTTSNSQTGGNIGGTVQSTATTSGNLSGTVTSDGSGNGGSSSRRSSGNGSTNSPSGSVLGASTSNTSNQTPGFPNAGFAPNEDLPRVTFWSSVVNFLKSIVSF